MEEQIEAFQQARRRQRRRAGGRKRHLLEKIAQPREVIIIRGSILGILGIAFAISVYTKNQSKESQMINFWDIVSYSIGHFQSRYSFVTIVIGMAYNIVALLLNLLQYYVPEIREKILFEFEFLSDKVIACLLGTGASAGLGASVDLEKASAYNGANSVLNMGKAVGSFLVAAFFLAFVLSLCSSRAFEERGLHPNDPPRGPEENERNPLSQEC